MGKNKKANKSHRPPSYVKDIVRHEGRMGISEAKMPKIFKNQMIPGYVTQSNFNKFFHNCLWLEEEKTAVMLRKYDMKNVTVTVVKGRTVRLKVPNLSEMKPTLVPGDLVQIRLTDYKSTYIGHIKSIEDSHIIFQIDKRLGVIIHFCPTIKMDVSFESGGVLFRRAHDGLDNIILNDTLKSLFPDQLKLKSHTQKYIIKDSEFFNGSIINNLEQKVAVQNILNCSSQLAPYILFGPPGTGKTVTIVEAIGQILQRTQKRILICAPSNAACDMLTSKLIPFCNKDQLVRIQSSARDLSLISKDVLDYSKMGSKIMPSSLNKFRIVVSTLIMIGKFHGEYSPEVLVVDEAGQATETDICVALGVLNHGGQIVLAGDPKQLGPIVQSTTAEKFRYHISLMERLMDTQNIYQNLQDSNFITMLKKNFRSHHKILELPNKLFYNSELKACAKRPLEDPISIMSIYPNIRKSSNEKLTFGQAIEFCAVVGEEKKEAVSPSYFNSAEVKIVIKYVKALIGMKLGRKNVKLSDIGIVAPYTRQVNKIKDLLKLKNLDGVEVGSTESFQGREKRIIIISTVRAKNKLGFVKDDKRFNVAVTRAISKLIIIGCPSALSTDMKWKKFMDSCKLLKTYFEESVNDDDSSKIKETKSKKPVETSKIKKKSPEPKSEGNGAIKMMRMDRRARRQQRVAAQTAHSN